MAKRLKRYFDEYSRYDQFHFMRISAVNAELGEGPYSSIIELRNIQKSLPFFFINFESGYFISCIFDILFRI